MGNENTQNNPKIVKENEFITPDVVVNELDSANSKVQFFYVPGFTLNIGGVEISNADTPHKSYKAILDSKYDSSFVQNFVRVAMNNSNSSVAVEREFFALTFNDKDDPMSGSYRRPEVVTQKFKIETPVIDTTAPHVAPIEASTKEINIDYMPVVHYPIKVASMDYYEVSGFNNSNGQPVKLDANHVVVDLSSSIKINSSKRFSITIAKLTAPYEEATLYLGGYKLEKVKHSEMLITAETDPKLEETRFFSDNVSTTERVFTREQVLNQSSSSMTSHLNNPFRFAAVLEKGQNYGVIVKLNENHANGTASDTAFKAVQKDEFIRLPK